MTDRVHPLVAALRAARVAQELPQRHVAEELGVTQHAVSMWESGARMPSLATAARWADALGTPLALVREAP